MKRSTAQVGRQMEMLPLEKWIAEERQRSNRMRPIGEIAAEVVERAGRPNAVGSGGGKAPHPIGPNREGEEVTSRNETGKDARAEARASYPHMTDGFRAAGLPTGTKHTSAGHGVMVMCFVMVGEAEHQGTSSGEDGTWIDF